MNFCKTPPLLRVCLRVLTLVLTLALAFAPAVTARAAGTWLRLTSEHFDMLSCTSERSSRKMLVQLEQFRVFFLRTMSNGRVYDPRPLIFVFDTDRQYTPYKILTPDGKERPSQGVFMGGAFVPRIMLENRWLEQGLSTIFHEYTHSLLLARLGQNVPAWFNEGFAEVFQTFETSGDKVTFGTTYPNAVLTMLSTPHIPLGTLFAVDYKSKYYNELDQMNIFYSQAWLLMHYAMLGKNNEPYTLQNMLRFVDESSRGGGIASAFEKVFGAGYTHLEDALDDYQNAGTYTGLTAKIPAKPINDNITVRLATDEERDIELAGLRWRANQAPDAVETLSALVEKYPGNPRVYEILAEIKMTEGETREATDYMRKAVEKKSTSPMVYIWLLRNYYTASNLPPDYIMPEDMAAEYTALVDRALELAPDCMEAYEMLATIESQKASMRIKKLNEVMKALPDMSDPGRTYLAMATVYWRLKRYSEAEAAVNELLKTPKSSYGLKRRANELLRRIASETGREPPPPLPPPANQNQIIIKMPSVLKQ